MASALPVNSAGSLKASDAASLLGETNATETLTKIRNAPLPGEDKAALRDLFLDFASERDPVRRESLQQEIMKRLPSRGTKAVATPTKPPVTTFGRSRLVPQFSAKPPVVEEKTVKAEAPPRPQAVEVPVAKAETPTPVPSGNPKLRIDEIKHAVNRRFGNPVNLISRNEAVGREYMAALLDAMKQASNGAVSASEALNRLEKAFAEAEKVSAEAPIKTKEKPEPKVTTTPVVKKLPAIEDTKPNPVLNLKPLPPPISTLEKPALKPTMAAPAKRESVPKTVPPVQKIVLSPVSAATTLPEEMTKLRTNAEKRLAEDNKPITDLKAEKVTAGLTQLLAEWKLFRSSGWFGTGAAGINHPLYRQLQGLSMAAVIAGRFEGATPEVKQSITDYMNGWRYEQGIVHEMEESFEHYLRRVILHILERSHDPLAVKKPM